MASAIQDLVRLNVRRLRMAQGLTQEELALKADCSRAYLAHLEARGRNISIEVLAALAGALDVDVRELLRPQDEWDDV